jgi:hypothetical protein
MWNAWRRLQQMQLIANSLVSQGYTGHDVIPTEQDSESRPRDVHKYCVYHVTFCHSFVTPPDKIAYVAGGRNMSYADPVPLVTWLLPETTCRWRSCGHYVLAGAETLNLLQHP